MVNIMMEIVPFLDWYVEVIILVQHVCSPLVQMDRTLDFVSAQM